MRCGILALFSPKLEILAREVVKAAHSNLGMR